MTKEKEPKVHPFPKADDEDRIFDPQYVRDDDDFVSQIPTKRRQKKIPVERPNKQQWFQVKSGRESSLPVKLIKCHDSSRYYLVGQDVKDVLTRHLISVQLYLAITPLGTLFLIPVHKHDSMGRSHQAQESLLDICEDDARASWIRIEYNPESGTYEVQPPQPVDSAEKPPPEPDWPDITWEEILKLAFKDCYILDLNHPFAKKLRGVL